MSAAADGGAAYVVEMLDQPDGTTKRRVRARTVSINRLSKRDLAAGAEAYPASINAEYERPVTRGDCLPGGCNEARPCPWISCKRHLYLDVNERNGSIKFNYPDLEVWDLPESCSLDVADRGGITLEEVGERLNWSRERVRQVEMACLDDLKQAAPELEDYLNDDQRTYATPVGVRNSGEGR